VLAFVDARSFYIPRLGDGAGIVARRLRAGIMDGEDTAQ